MKKTYLLGSLFALVFAFFGATSCSDNDNVDPYDGSSAELNYNSGNAKAWGNYMKNVAILLNNDAANLCSQWTENFNETGTPYATLFKNHASETTYTSAQSCVQEMVEKMAEIANEVGSSKIGDPYDKWTSGNQTAALYAVESWYSWHSRDDYTNNIVSIENAYYGNRNHALTGAIADHSMAKLLEGTAIDTKVRKGIADAKAAIQAITQPFRNHIGSAEAKAAMEACSELQKMLSEVKNDEGEVEEEGDDVNLRDALVAKSEAELQPIIENYVDNVVVPTYQDLKTQNAALLAAVNSFVASPSDAGFEACTTAWLNARTPWETSEAFLFGPVDIFGLDPNMDSWPLDQDAIVQIMKSAQWSSLEWTDGDDDAKVESAQNVRGFHTLEFLIFKDGKPRTVK